MQMQYLPRSIPYLTNLHVCFLPRPFRGREKKKFVRIPLVHFHFTLDRRIASNDPAVFQSVAPPLPLLRNECVSDALQPTTVVAPSGDNGSLRGQGLGRCALATYGINVTAQLRGVEFQHKDQFSVHRTAKTLFLGCVNPPRLRPRITQPRKSIFSDLYKGNAWVSQLYQGPGYLLNTWGWACV